MITRWQLHAVMLLSALTSAGAQQPPAIRQVGRLERASVDSLASVATVVALPDGRVLVNDMTSRRVLLLDSTLAHPVVVADTTSATANAYGRNAGTLIRYRADTALFIDINSLSMLVIGPTGKIHRVLAIPRPDEAQHLIGHVFGLPGFDARGRLVYHGAAGMEGTFILCCVGTSRRPPGTPSYAVPKPDSGFVVRADLATRAYDTVTSVKIPYSKQRVNVAPDGYVQSIESRNIPLPIVDLWATTADGSIAVVRGRDYHVDWLDASGRWTSFPKMPFDWQRIDDERKRALIDSSAKAEQAKLERVNARRAEANGAGAGTGRGAASGDGGRGAGGPGRGGVPIPSVAAAPELSDIPDYVPPFSEGGLYTDLENNLWIRTSAVVKGQPVYDVVNRQGQLFDRVQLPPFRTIAGFGPGVVYMAVKDSVGVVHLERARIK